MLTVTKTNIAIIGLLQAGIILIGTFAVTLSANMAENGYMHIGLLTRLGTFGFILLPIPFAWAGTAAYWNRNEDMAPLEQAMVMIIGIMIAFVLALAFLMAFFASFGHGLMIM